MVFIQKNENNFKIEYYKSTWDEVDFEVNYVIRMDQKLVCVNKKNEFRGWDIKKKIRKETKK